MDQENRPWDVLRELMDQSDAIQVEHYLANLGVGETARAISHLPTDEQQRLFRLLSPETAANLVELLPKVQVGEIFQELGPGAAAEILVEMPSNERADVLNTLDGPGAEAIFQQMPSQTASESRQLADYPSDVAGGLMITEFLAYSQDTTVGRVVGDMRQNTEAYSDYDVQYTYVVEPSGVLAGVLRLRDLLLAASHKPISRIMIPTPMSVRDTDRLRILGEFFDQSHFLGAPVVDNDGVLLGVVRRHDVEGALAARADNDHLKTQGIIGGEELRTMPLWRRSYRRLSWLGINIGLNILAASIIAAYQDTLAAIIALAVFLPIISDMSGCSGNQAVAVSMRELSLGLVKPYEIVRVWLKEIGVGLINGIVLGLLLGFAAWLWKGNLVLGLVVAAALAANTVVAVSIGGTVPLLLKRLKMDPALASGPILTTITDMCGFFLVLSLATLVLVELQ